MLVKLNGVIESTNPPGADLGGVLDAFGRDQGLQVVMEAPGIVVLNLQKSITRRQSLSRPGGCLRLVQHSGGVDSHLIPGQQVSAPLEDGAPALQAQIIRTPGRSTAARQAASLSFPARWTFARMCPWS